MKSALRLIHVLFFLFEICVFGDAVKAETVSVIEGESVTLHTGVTEIQIDDGIEWWLNGKRIAKISGDSSSADGVFRDRLKQDHQTGDLTITNIQSTDSGEYILKIFSTKGSPEKIFSISVVSAVKSVSVTVGDSVTLNSGTIIQSDDVMEWRFADLNSPIAEHNRKTGNFSTSDGPDGIFRHRLQLDYSTGSLTIRNIGTKHSGLYEAVIRKNSSGYTVHQSYSVTVRGERKPALSVKKGESVTLHTDLTDIHTDDLMLWMFKNTVIADINKAVDRFNTSDGRFKDRLKLDEKTGSLTITDTRTEDSGLYELKIISSRFTINKRITVTVSGERKSALSVMKGDSVTLHTDLTEIHTDDVMLWMFEDTVIIEINKADDLFNTSDDVLDGRFRDRLKLDHQTGSLTITDIRNTDSGLYELKIFSSRFTIDKRITVTVSGLSQGEIAGIVLGVLLACAAAFAAGGVIYQRRKISKQKQASTTLSVMEGECVPLIPYGTDIPEDEDIRWKFGGDVIAERKRADQKIIVYHDNVLGGKFKGKLELDKGSGTLIINNITTTHSGQYELCSSRSGNTSLKTFRVSVSDKTTIEKVSVKKGESVTLRSGVTGIQKDDEILWKFGLVETPIAQITDGTKKISRFAAGWRFIFRLKLDHQTGSMTITKIKIIHTGFYVLYIFKSGETSMKLFKVKVFEKNPEEEVSLNNFP